MSKDREIEAKTILAKNVYQKISKAFPIKEDFQQANYYFDTDDNLLKKHNIGCRIRIFSDHAEKTLKVPDPRPVQKQFHEVIEINDKLKLEEANSLIKKAQTNDYFIFQGNIGQYLSKHFADKQKKLRLQTWSKTHRILANGPENCELTFDATSYPDGFEDYEFEIENTNPTLIKKILIQLEKKYGFKQTANNTNQNKIARAYNHRSKN